MKLRLLKLVEFETRNHFTLQLTVHSNHDSDDFRDSNLETTEFEMFFSEREGSGMQLAMTSGSRFSFKHDDLFKNLYAYHFCKIHNFNRLKTMRKIFTHDPLQ